MPATAHEDEDGRGQYEIRDQRRSLDQHAQRFAGGAGQMRGDSHHPQCVEVARRVVAIEPRIGLGRPEVDKIERPNPVGVNVTGESGTPRQQRELDDRDREQHEQCGAQPEVAIAPLGQCVAHQRVAQQCGQRQPGGDARQPAVRVQSPDRREQGNRARQIQRRAQPGRGLPHAGSATFLARV